ncbi:MAG: cytidylate kinase [Crocinitomicaceae bacterium]|jgi:cytidylate kinase|nr:cytidylate kinase [Crocinitomicaceae bacterium]|tara:strand:- start:10558 stop:11217 length:660 start_codon:yes stop_codon:yes gene_type:complete
MKKINVITIDGPSASGKGALARGIANSLGFNILDSGVLYRLYAYLSNISYSPDEIAIQIQKYVLFKKSEERLSVIYKKNDITSEIRSEIIAKSASEHSSKKEVREALLNIQRSFYDGKGLVADGRDMGTVVFKDAKLKIFLTATSKERAKRRYIELQNLGQEVNMPALIADIEKRDIKDSSRELSPLLPAEDAHIIDSSDMTLDEVFSFTENLIKEEFI